MASALLLAIVGISTFSPCPMRNQILPCLCKRNGTYNNVLCENMISFDQVVNSLNGHFTPSDRVALTITLSNLNDLPYRSFKELNMNIVTLKLNNDSIGPLNADMFEGLNKVNFLSLADTPLEVLPEEMWKKMPKLKTVDLGRTKIKDLSDATFKHLPGVESLLIPTNQITKIDTNAIPPNLRRLHIGRNYIKDLNSTLVNKSDLVWLLINNNELTTLENQLPLSAPNLRMLHAADNQIEKVPKLQSYPVLESLFLEKNRITRLDGAFARCRMLDRIVLEHNSIDTLTEEDFAENEKLQSLFLSFNQITTLNNSLLNLRNLRYLNMTYNYLTDFSFQELVGLQKLEKLDLSHNQISILMGPVALFQNMVEVHAKLDELRLDHNLLESLNGALAGLPELEILDLSNNLLSKISSIDFIGLDKLRELDISSNRIATLEETNKIVLPSLSILKATNNEFTSLKNDFHGFPVLCFADFSTNQIVSLGRELVTKTRCRVDGTPEPSWDTLKIDLQNNPILCDADLLQIQSYFEGNHTKICGVAHCSPLNEPSVTTKPALIGFVAMTTSLPAIESPSLVAYLQPKSNDLGNNIKAGGVALRDIEQYAIQEQIPSSSNNHISVKLPIIDAKRLSIVDNLNNNLVFNLSTLSTTTMKPPNEHLQTRYP